MSVTCSICLDDIPQKDIIYTTCFHPFHQKCLKRWFITQNRTRREQQCPVCRRIQNQEIKQESNQSNRSHGSSGGVWDSISSAFSRIFISNSTTSTHMNNNESKITNTNVRRNTRTNHTNTQNTRELQTITHRIAMIEQQQELLEYFLKQELLNLYKQQQDVIERVRLKQLYPKVFQQESVLRSRCQGWNSTQKKRCEYIATPKYNNGYCGKHQNQYHFKREAMNSC